MARRKKQQRRSPGSGYIVATPNGRFKAFFPKAGGGYHIKTHDTHEEAAGWLADLATQHAQRFDVTGGRQTLQVWADRFLEYRAPDLKAKTLADYRFKLGYALDLLGYMPIGDVLPDHIDDAMAIIGRSLAATTTRQIRNLLKLLFDEAQRRRYITFNPAIPPARRRRVPRKKPIRLSAAEAARLIDTLDTDWFRLALWLMLTLTLREGEVLGLRRGDVDLEKLTITIREQNTTLEGRPYFETPKGEHSARVLPLPAALAPLVQAQMDITIRRAARSKVWQEHALLFPGHSGKPMYPTNLLHRLKDTLPRAELPSLLTVHHLRHTAGQFYTIVGAPLDPIIQAILGHSPRTMSGHYAPPPVETLRPWTERVYALIVDAQRARQLAQAS
jgi:integrase